MKRRSSLVTRIIANVALAFLLMLGIVSFFHYHAMERYWKESETQKGELLLKSISPTIAIDIYLGMEGALQEYLEGIVRTNPMILKLTVEDISGKRLFDYVSPALNNQEVPPIRLRQPLLERVESRPLGEVEMYYSNAGYATMLHNYREFTALLMLGALALVLLLLYRLRARLVPLHRLASQLREYDPRKKNHPKERVEGDDEIAVIQNALVEMFEKIEGYTSRMFELNLQLETKIRERTQILEKTNDKLKREIEERTRTEEALKRANELLERLSTRDALTDLYNRRIFEENLENYWKVALREEKPISVILCDIDFFKQINDTYGHLAGDRCLVELAAILKECVRRPMDLVARYGGEEFVFVLPDTPLMGAVTLANEIQKKIHARNERPDTDIHFTLSLGVATVVPGRRVARTDLVRAADAALYEAKRKGRNRIEVRPL